MTTEKKTARGRGHVTRNFCWLNINSTKTAKDTNFKSGTYAPRETSDMTLNFFEWGVARFT